jgi:hypothetical protein
MSRNDEGSVLPLALGYAVLVLALVLLCTVATSLYLAQKRLDDLADGAALAAADGFTLTVIDGTPRPELSDAAVSAQARDFVDAVGGGAALVSARTPDGMSARVRVSDAWHPPVFSLFVPDGLTLEATATSRNALR